MPSNVTSIGDGALEGAPIKSVSIPSYCTASGSRAFANCTKLEALSIPSSVTTVGAGLTEGCVALKTVSLEESTSPINLGTAEDGAFATLTAYTLNMSRPVTLTGTAVNSPFAGTGLVKVVYNAPNGDYETAGLFGQSVSLKDVEVGRNAYKEGIGVFRDASAFENVEFTDALTGIGDYAFANCTALKTVALPENLTTLGAGSFSGIKMDKVSCVAVTPPTCPDDAFSDETYSAPTLEVKAEQLEAYKGADGWKKFTQITEDESLAVDDIVSEGVTPVVVTDMQGRTVYTGTDADMHVTSPGIYVVRRGAKVNKILVK